MLPQLPLHKALGSLDGFVQQLVQHYINAVLTGILRILGSADFIGNPMMLVDNVSSGAVDFFYEPAMASMSNPQELTQGLRKGAASLVGGTLSGVANTTEKFAGFLERGLLKLTGDSKFRRAMQHRARGRGPDNAGTGALEGSKGLAYGVYAGLRGLVQDPSQGWKKHRFGGMVGGIASGLAGVGLKPAAGMLDMISSTMRGVKNMKAGPGSRRGEGR